MKKLVVIAIVVSAANLSAAPQSGSAEQEVRGFLTEYDRAVAGRDLAFLERVLPDDYVYTGASGRMSDRSRVLAFFKQLKDKPTYTMDLLTHDNVVVRVTGDMAVVTNDYTAQTKPVDEPDLEPHTDKGRHIAVLEKRDGRWTVIAEQDTEQPHDEAVMKRQVFEAGRAYNQLMKRLKSGRSYPELEKSGDMAALERLLTENYTYTSRDGELFDKAQDLAGYKNNRIPIASAEFLEQDVRIVDNNTAIETGAIRYVGTNARKPFDLVKRYTTTWVFTGARWQIVADHTSMLRQPPA